MEVEELISHSQLTTDIAVLIEQMGQVKREIEEIKGILISRDDKFLTKEEFRPYKMIIGGFVAVVLTSFVGGLAVLIWKV